MRLVCSLAAITLLVTVTFPSIAAASHHHYRPPSTCYDDGKADSARIDALAIDDSRAVFDAGAIGEYGTFHVGSASDNAIGFSLHAGVRFDRLALVGQLEPFGLTGNKTPSGIALRSGLAVRYSLFSSVDRNGNSPFAKCGAGIGRSDLLVELGAGWQHVELHQADGLGTFDRPDVELTLGWTETGRTSSTFHAGMFLGVRLMIAPAPPGATLPNQGPDTAIFGMFGLDLGG